MGTSIGCALGCCENKENKGPVLDPARKASYLKTLDLFKDLEDSELRDLAAGSDVTMFSKGTTIFHEGDYAADLFIIASGTAVVSVGGKRGRVGTLGAGDHFGESGLILDTPRNATVVTESPLQALKVSRQQFEAMNLHRKLRFKHKRRAQIMVPSRIRRQAPSLKGEADIVVILNAIKTNKNLSSIVELDDEQCQQMCTLAWQRTVSTDECVIKQGNWEADFFYIVKDGSFEISIDSREDGVINEDHAVNAYLQHCGVAYPGSSFGELALLSSSPRSASVKALEPSTVWIIDRDTFKRICARKADDYAKMYDKYLQRAPQLACFGADERLALARALLESNFRKDEIIFEQGDDGTVFYILYEGEVAVIKHGQELTRLIATPESVEFFGEQSVIEATPYPTTVKVVSETAKMLSMDKDTFEIIHEKYVTAFGASPTGRNARFMNKMIVGGGAYAAAVQLADTDFFFSSDKICFEDLEVLGLLGCGGFGRVELVEHRTTKVSYALKCIAKSCCTDNHRKKMVLCEKNIHMECHSDFIVRLYATYNGKQHLYFLMESGLGGDLQATYIRNKLWGSNEHARFYTAGVVFALEHMHRKKIIYRDLKPENILLNEKGHAKIADMGLATICVGKTFTKCGTPEYMAPEIIAQTGHDHTVDWWALGVLTFELMTGHSPFTASSEVGIYERITKGIRQIRFPNEMLRGNRLFIRSMCDADPAERLPRKLGGVGNITNHEWYADFDWASMKAHKVPPPYIPPSSKKNDIKNFSGEEAYKPEEVPYEDDGSAWDKDFATGSMTWSRTDELFADEIYSAR